MNQNTASLIFYKNIKNCLHMGFPLNKSLNLIIQSEKQKKILLLAKKLKKELHQGKNICESLANTLPETFPSNLKKIKNVANIEDFFEGLYKHTLDNKQNKEELIKKLRYPCLLLGIITIAGTLSYTLFMPNCLKFFSSNHLPLPLILQIYKSIKSYINTHKFWILFFFYLVSANTFYSLRKLYLNKINPQTSNINLLWHIGLLLKNGLSIQQILDTLDLPERHPSYKKWKTLKHKVSKTAKFNHEISQFYQLTPLEKAILTHAKNQMQLSQNYISLYQTLKEKEKEKFKNIIKAIQPCCFFILSLIILVLLYSNLLPMLGSLNQYQTQL
eukprot:COSAG01_NODE_2_length_63927_cov_1357.611941_23_plen_330_part_00